jgi:hypothetical protein
MGLASEDENGRWKHKTVRARLNWVNKPLEIAIVGRHRSAFSLASGTSDGYCNL